MKSASITKTELQALRKRVTALEEQVRELQQRPTVHIHQQPYIPQPAYPYVNPLMPVVCGGNKAAPKDGTFMY